MKVEFKNKNFDYETLNEFLNSIGFVLTDISTYDLYIDELTYSNTSGAELKFSTNIDTDYIISKLKGSTKNENN